MTLAGSCFRCEVQVSRYKLQNGAYLSRLINLWKLTGQVLRSFTFDYMFVSLIALSGNRSTNRYSED